MASRPNTSSTPAPSTRSAPRPAPASAAASSSTTHSPAPSPSPPAPSNSPPAPSSTGHPPPRSGAQLNVDFTTNSHPSGTFDATGTGNITWTGQITTAADLTLSFEPGEWTNQITQWDTTTLATITNVSYFPVDTSTFITDGFVNAASGTVVQSPSTGVSLADGVVVNNAGIWRLDANSGVFGSGGVTTEHFVNTGTVDKIGAATSASISSGIVFDDTLAGTVTVTAGTLQLAAGTLVDWTPSTTSGAQLNVDFTTNSHPSGTFDATGTGNITWTGQITTAADLTLSFEPGEWTNQITQWDTTTLATITNVSYFPVDTSTFITDGFVNAASGTVVQSPSTGVSLADGATVTNTGTWKLAAGSGVFGNGGVTTEVFTNHGTVLLGDGNSVRDQTFATIGSGAAIDNTGGTVTAQRGILSATMMTAEVVGTWHLINATLQPDSGAAVNRGTIHVTGQSRLGFFDLTNEGLVVLDEHAVADLSFATFINGTTGVIHTTIGDAATMGFGQLRADQVTLGGALVVAPSAAHPPTLADAYTVVRSFFSLDGTFATVNGVTAPHLLQYTPTRAVISATGRPPYADAGQNYFFVEGDPSSQLFGGQSDTDGAAPITTYSWSPLVGLSNTSSANPTFDPIDDLDTIVLLRVCNANVCDIDRAVVEVSNEPPVVTVATGLTAFVDEPFTDTLATFTDPGAADTHTASIGWEFHAPVAVGPVSTSVAGTFTFTTLGLHFADVCVTDDDGGASCDTATINVVSHNKAPTLHADAATTTEGVPVIIDVLANDTDTDGPPLVVSSTVNGSHGDVVVNPDQTVTYTPDAKFNGTDTFTYFANDTINLDQSAVVTVTITGPNDPPTVVLGDQHVFESATPVAFATVNDPDSPFGALTYLWSPAARFVDPTAANPVLVDTDDTSFSASVQVCDDGPLCATGTGIITVDNLAPVVSVTVNPITTVGTVVTLHAAVVDPGPLDTVTATVNWGDGAVEPAVIVAGAIDAVHTYTVAGAAPLSVCATDDDGGVGCNGHVVTVRRGTNQAPVANTDAVTASRGFSARHPGAGQ